MLKIFTLRPSKYTELPEIIHVLSYPFKDNAVAGAELFVHVILDTPIINDDSHFLFNVWISTCKPYRLKYVLI